jgi:hypothetical protein
LAQGAVGDVHDLSSSIHAQISAMRLCCFLKCPAIQRQKLLFLIAEFSTFAAAKSMPSFIP